MNDAYDLQRFVTAQDEAGTYQRARQELQQGRKTSHWMWFVFPQIAGLGQSAMSRRYALSSLEEAQAYLRHPVLGPRLIDCAGLLAAILGRSAEEILGNIGARKLKSSMTLFTLVTPDQPEFLQVLDKYFGGERDVATEELVTPHGEVT